MGAGAALLAASLAAAPRTPSPSGSGSGPIVPGRSAGETLLPNGWRIAPVGRHIQIGDLPLAMAESPDGRYLLVTNNGFAKPTLTLVDLARRYVRKTSLDNAWLGLAWNAAGDRVFSSAGKENAVREFRFRNGRLAAGASYALPLASLKSTPTFADAPVREQTAFVGGLALEPSGKRLYAVNVLGQTLSAVDLASGKAAGSVELPAEPYTCLVSPDGATLFVSLWGGSKVLLFDPATLAPKGEIPTGEHPNAMAALQGRRDALRRLREHELGLGRGRRRRGNRSSRSRSRWSRRRRPARRPTAWGCRRTARRSSSRTPTTTPSRSSTCRGRARRACAAGSRRAGIRPARSSRRTARRSSSSPARGSFRRPTRGARSRRSRRRPVSRRATRSRERCRSCRLPTRRRSRAGRRPCAD